MSLPSQPLDPLTPREQDVLRLLAQGLSDQQIAHALVLAVSTVKWYNRQIYSKLGVSRRSRAVAQALRLGLLDDPGEAGHAPDRPRYPLPAEVTSFVGRERELADLERLLQRARLVTLTGAPGAGKTRLALRAARAALPAYRDGVCFVSLAALDEPGHVRDAIARALGIEERGSRTLSDLMAQQLAARQLLLALDNFEHLLAAAAQVGELVAATPELTVLVTSREPLHLYGEHVYPVSPLGTPDLYAPLDRASVMASDAVQLFVQRAQAAVPEFTVTGENTPAIAAICAHLDGLPLAIELAAAQVRLYPPRALLVRLGSRLDLLTDGPRDLPARQRTLRSTLAWSFDLLAPAEQALFSRLGIFSGGCALDAAQAICVEEDGADLAGVLASLFDKSLLQRAAGDDGEPRFWMLETVREYALERLAARGERDTISAQHAAYFADFAGRTHARLFGRDQLRSLAEFNADYDNLRAALRWSLARPERAALSFRLASGLARFWTIQGQFSEGRAWLTQVLAAHQDYADHTAVADARYGLAELAYHQSDYDVSGREYRQALALYDATGERWKAAQCLLGLGNVATEIGDYEAAPALFEEAYTIMRALDDTYGSARALAMLGWCALRPGDYALAKERLLAALDLYRQIGETDGEGLVLSGLGEIAIRQGELQDANALLHDSLTLRRRIGDQWGIGTALGSLGWAALLAGDLACATGRLAESLTVRHQIGDTGGAAWCLEKLGELCALRQRDRTAVRLLGTAATLRASVGSVIDPADLGHYEQVVSALRARLGAASFARAWAKGQATDIAQVMGWLAGSETI